MAAVTKKVRFTLGAVLLPLHDNPSNKGAQISQENLALWRRIVQAVADRGMHLSVHANQRESLAAFLEHVSLVMELEQNEGETDRLNLMTLHAAKGLEFETVFLPGWEEGLFPSQRTLDEKGNAGLEEERRLAYVGLTRAKTRAFVSFAANRRVHGQWQSALPSRFIGELPDAHIDNVAGEGFYGNYEIGRAHV